MEHPSTKLEEPRLMWPALTWWTLRITLQIFTEIATTVTPWSNFSKIPRLVSFEAEVPNSESMLLTATLYCLPQEKREKTGIINVDPDGFQYKSAQ